MWLKDFICSLTPKAIRSDTEAMINKIDSFRLSHANMEKELSYMKRTLRKEQNLRAAVLNNLGDMVWAKDMNGRYIMVNDTFREKFCYGLYEDEIKGKTDVELAKIFKGKVGYANHTFGEMCANSDAIIHKSEEAREFLEQGLIDGSVMRLVVNKSPLFNFRGTMYGTCGVGRDVTQWYNDLEVAINSHSACFGKAGADLLLKELNKLEFK